MILKESRLSQFSCTLLSWSKVLNIFSLIDLKNKLYSIDEHALKNMASFLLFEWQINTLLNEYKLISVWSK